MQVERITSPVVEQTEIVLLAVERLARRDGIVSIEELRVIREARKAVGLADEADATVGCAVSLFRRDGVRGQQFGRRLRALQEDLSRIGDDPDPTPDGPGAGKKIAA